MVRFKAWESRFMDSINDALAAVLQSVRIPGDFYAAGHCALHVPLIEVDGVGPIALPLLPAQAAQLIAVAERAPYGRGGETLVDTAVRRTWQIGADRVRIAGKHWTAMLDSVVERVATGLGAGAGVVAELYKLLVYDEGSFFVTHRDTEKSAGMFATLIVALPSLHTGGELEVRHRGREVRLDLRSTDFSELAWAAFYADCVHEVMPITSGCRLVLVYNLRRLGKGRLPRPPSYEQETTALGQLLRRWSELSARSTQDLPAKLVYPLEHAYTPAELSFVALKGADAATAGVLAAAARDAACDLHVALLRIEESGAAEHSDYARSRYSRRYHDDDDEDEDDNDEFRVAEVFERSLTLSDWSRPDGAAVSLGTMPFIDSEVCPGDALADMDPDEQHFEEATGNEGASFERSYQRAALVLWPQAQKLRLLARAGFAVSLPMLGSLATAWVAEGADPDSKTWREAHALAAQMLACWPARATDNVLEGRSAEAAMLAHLTRLRDLEHIDNMLAGAIAAGAYSAQDNAVVVQGLKLLAPSRVGPILLGVVRGNADLHIAGCADLLARAAAVPAWRVQLQNAAMALLDAMPGDPSRPQTQADAWRRERADAAVIHDTLRALVLAEHADLVALADRAVTHWLAWPKTYGLDTIIVPALRLLAERPALMDRPACQRLRAAALAHLQTRVSLDLVPPADWRRDAQMRCRCEHCQSLVTFLRSAEREVWRFKAREADRRHVEDAIRQGHHDVDCTTEREGSPHVLVCNKNQASYERKVAQRRKDLDSLRRLGA
jgi:predicted 2-oxoglutarate/Fe(II)-dependent dioxygenase YbiX